MEKEACVPVSVVRLTRSRNADAAVRGPAGRQGPGITEPMRRYLEQIACVLRPGSVVNTDQTLRCFAAFLAEAVSGFTGLAQVTRRHIEAFKSWLAARPG